MLQISFPRSENKVNVLCYTVNGKNKIEVFKDFVNRDVLIELEFHVL